MQLVQSIPSVNKPQEPKLIWKDTISTLDLRSSSCPHSRLAVKILTLKKSIKAIPDPLQLLSRMNGKKERSGQF